MKVTNTLVQEIETLLDNVRNIMNDVWTLNPIDSEWCDEEINNRVGKFLSKEFDREVRDYEVSNVLEAQQYHKKGNYAYILDLLKMKYRKEFNL